jgi:hypothetical protein
VIPLLVLYFQLDAFQIMDIAQRPAGHVILGQIYQQVATQTPDLATLPARDVMDPQLKFTEKDAAPT